MWSLSAGWAVAFAGAAIIPFRLRELALAASAGLLPFCPCGSTLTVQAAFGSLVNGLAGLGCGWEHLATAAALEPT